MDFGPAATDYARFRAGFPKTFFERVRLAGRVLDLGSGTGVLARGFEEQGAQTVAVDLSPTMLGQAGDLPRRVAALAEATPFRDGVFDHVVAGQCWHWFNGPATARECRRLLRPGGQLLIAHFDYLAVPGNAASETETLILQRNPKWAWAASDGRYERWRPHLQWAGFEEIAVWEYDEEVVYTHEGWRGRTRACNGVIALRDPERIAELDVAVGRMLANRFPNPVSIPHRVFVISGRAPLTPTPSRSAWPHPKRHAV